MISSESEPISLIDSSSTGISYASQGKDGSGPSSIPNSFRQSPQCTADQESILRLDHSITKETGVETLIVSGTSATVFDVFDPAAGITAGLTLTGPTTFHFPIYTITYSVNDYDGCCGQCFLSFEQVQVRYFPVPGTNTACLSDVSPTTTEGDQIAEAAIKIPSFASNDNATAKCSTMTSLATITTDRIPDQSYAIGLDGYT